MASEAGPPDQASFGVQMVLGAGAFLFLLAGLGVLILADGQPLGLLFSLIPIGLGVWVLVLRARRGPGLWVGFLIGVGLTVLAFGLCAALLTGGFH